MCLSHSPTCLTHGPCALGSLGAGFRRAGCVHPVHVQTPACKVLTGPACMARLTVLDYGEESSGKLNSVDVFTDVVGAHLNAPYRGSFMALNRAESPSN